MTRKKLMILGGSRYAVPVVEAAHRLGVHVITADYLPDNAAHKVSDESCNVSVVDKKTVLEAARALRIDGIVSFACDPGVVSAAYVAEKMGLPFQGPYESVAILQDKGWFRQFLADHGFNAPRAKRYSDPATPLHDIDFFRWPVIVKPVDSAGSKGVSRVDVPRDMPIAIDAARAASLCGDFIVEEFLEFDGYHSSVDPFSVEGELAFVTYSDQLFDKEANNPYTPAQIIWPSTMAAEHQTELTGETQRLLRLLGMATGLYNIETCVAIDGTPYLMEVSPRGGGCKIAELQRLAFGVDLIEAEVCHAVGLPLPEIRSHSCDGHWCEFVIHAKPGQSGVFQRLEIDPVVRAKYVKVLDLAVLPGDTVHPFTGANRSLGDLFLRCESRAELDALLDRSDEWLKVVVE